MWEQIGRIVRQASTQIADQVAAFLPGVVVATSLAVIALLIAILARALLLRILRGIDFDERAVRWGMPTLIGLGPTATPSAAAAKLAFWAILVLGLLVSLTALNASMPSRLALSAFEYVPHLLAACLILLVGTVAARLLARSALIGAVNMQIRGARLIGMAVKWLVLLVTVAMALAHLGIGRHVLLLAFGILFGGVILAAALAIGLGAREAVSEVLLRQLRRSSPSEDRIDHV
jgi:hypothetical protein